MVSAFVIAPSRRVGLRGCGFLQAVEKIERAGELFFVIPSDAVGVAQIT
jgi:hypothetical protein